MNSPGPAPLWRRAVSTVKDQGPGALLAKAGDYLAAEALRARFKWSGAHGPKILTDNRVQDLDPASIKCVAFLKYWGMGDMILALPALQMLKARFKEARFVLAGSTGAGRVVEGAGLFDAQWLTPLAATEGASPGLYRSLKAVRDERPDLVFISHPLISWRIAEVVDRLGARFVAGSLLDLDAARMNVVVPAASDRHVARVNADVALALGCEGPVPRPDLRINEAERKAARQWLDQHAPDGPRACFHVGATPHLWHKRWPAENFVELGERLARERGMSLVLLEGPDEGESVKKVADGLSQPPAICGSDLSLRETMALVESMDLMVANDSVWMHVAAAVGTPTLGLFGPVSPTLYGPFGDPATSVAISSPAACAPCWKPGTPVRCQDPVCMKSISVKRVTEEIKKLLDDSLVVS